MSKPLPGSSQVCLPPGKPARNQLSGDAALVHQQGKTWSSMKNRTGVPAQPRPGPQGTTSSPLLLRRAVESKAAKPGPRTALERNTYGSSASTRSAGDRRTDWHTQVQQGKGHLFLTRGLTLEQVHWPPPALVM